MPDFVKEQKISYPVAADVDGKTVKAYAVDSYPDYYLIDRMGILRVADLQNDDLERAVKVLLAEGQEKTVDPDAGTKVAARDDLPVKHADLPIEEQDARAMLTQARGVAAETDRKIFIHVGGPG